MYLRTKYPTEYFKFAHGRLTNQSTLYSRMSHKNYCVSTFDFDKIVDFLCSPIFDKHQINSHFEDKKLTNTRKILFDNIGGK